MQALQIEDIQGIVLFGYGRLRSASYLLLRITQPAAAKVWLRTLDVRNAKFDPATTDRSINVAFTPAGLARLFAEACLCYAKAGFGSALQAEAPDGCWPA